MRYFLATLLLASCGDSGLDALVSEAVPAAVAACGDGPTWISAGFAEPLPPAPVQPAFRYASGACQLSWAVHNDQNVNCGFAPGWQVYYFENKRGDGQLHWDEQDRTYFFGKTFCG